MLTRKFFLRLPRQTPISSGVCRDTKIKYWYGPVSPQYPRRKYLPPKLQASFANKQMACVEYDRLSDYEEREVFQVCATDCMFYWLFIGLVACAKSSSINCKVLHLGYTLLKQFTDWGTSPSNDTTSCRFFQGNDVKIFPPW